MIFDTGCKTENGYKIEVQFWKGADTKKYWPFFDYEEIKEDLGNEFEVRLERALKAVSAFVIDFGLPTIGIVINDEMGYCEVVYVSVSPIDKSIQVGVYADR